MGVLHAYPPCLAEARERSPITQGYIGSTSSSSQEQEDSFMSDLSTSFSSTAFDI